MLYTKLVVKSMVFGWAILVCCFSSIALCKSKSVAHKTISLACDKDSCGFAVQDTLVEGLKWCYSIHASLYHKMTVEEQKKHFIVKDGPYKPQTNNVKFIVCPENDGFAIWSNYDDVLFWFFKEHTRILHGKEMTDEEVKKLITSVQK